MAPTPGLLTRAYYNWKALRLPWRKRFFIGHDLQGNTYWEFKLTSSETRLRRIVNYPRSTHLSQVQVSPLWHQWLRHMRAEAPSLDEQRGDLVRRDRTRILAAEADARWEAKPRVMTAGESQALSGGGERTDTKTEVRQTQQQETIGVGAGAGQGTETTRGAGQEEVDADDAWSRAKKAQAVGEKWQPAAWSPSSKR
ncbi:hypothetical protein E4U21_000800 [Claviceps maximensis]|nr:hypothetical protein E4U21_000800 [Claviceps maximensis]